ncbi:MAG: hypothetical protein CMJ31_00595 [Phycisphaerae bacterium]|nr:hypothetical protein [Phycisphaerae bacterium]
MILGRADTSRGTPEMALERAREFEGLGGAYLVDRGGVAHLAYGAYAGPRGSEAQADLARIRTKTPFRTAVLLPLAAETGAAAADTELDLRTVAKRYGPNALYTLQVAVYGLSPSDPRQPSGEDLASFRRAAEDAAAAFRAAGEEAFYLHGPQNSIVTIGVFGREDLDDSVNPPVLSRRLRETHERHPHNLLNGQAIRMTGRAASGAVVEQLQTSQLVEVPGAGRR